MDIREGDVVELVCEESGDLISTQLTVAVVKPGNVIVGREDPRFLDLTADYFLSIMVLSREGEELKEPICIRYHCHECGRPTKPFKAAPLCTCPNCMTEDERKTCLNANQPYVPCVSCGATGVEATPGEYGRGPACETCDGFGYLFLLPQATGSEKAAFNKMREQLHDEVREQFHSETVLSLPPKPDLDSVAMVEQIRIGLHEGIEECVETDPSTDLLHWKRHKLLEMVHRALPKRGLKTQPVVKLEQPDRETFVDRLWEKVEHCLKVFTEKVISKHKIEEEEQKRLTRQLLSAFHSWLKFANECNGQPADEILADAYTLEISLDPCASPTSMLIRLLIEPPERIQHNGDKGGEEWKKA